MAKELSDRRTGVDMRPGLEDEVNAAWAEVNRARAERDRLRAENEALKRDPRGSLHEDKAEIRRLRAENERLRETLTELVDLLGGVRISGLTAKTVALGEAWNRACAELAGASDEQPAPEDSIAAEQDRENDEWAERVRSDEEEGR